MPTTASTLDPVGHRHPGDPPLLPCQAGDPDLFFAESPRRLAAAQALCQDCPIRAECLAAAIERAEPCGVWGGRIFVNGAIVMHKRARGRPPKRKAG